MSPNKVSFVIIAATLLGACGNLSGPGPQTLPESSYGRSGVSASLGTSDYTCPSSPNVIPDYDWAFNGTGHFRVCHNPADFAEILVSGQTNLSNTICIFPVQYIDEEHIYTKPDLTTGAPLAECVQLTSAGAKAKFPNMNFNAAFIVEKQNLEQMRSCLLGGNYFNCPHYSYGRFR